ncbi:MAG TPA: fused MFS/spermidine synthase [Drouetiella sp.]
MLELEQKTSNKFPGYPELPPNLVYVEPRTKRDSDHLNLTFIEDSDSFDTYNYKLEKILVYKKTAYQTVLIADSINYGRILVLDGAIQSSEDDEALYHEMLVQPAMLRHPNPQNVLIIGGGEGATLREVLVHSSVRSVTMVDLDQEVVELCKEHLTSWHRNAFDDPRVKVVFADGRKFVEEDDSRYDVVIIDVVDMLDNGPAQALYTKQFYQMLKQRLRENAIVVVQGLEFSFLDDKQHAALARTLRSVFAETHSYRVGIPSFLSSWGFLVASDWFVPKEWSVDAIDTVARQKLGTEWLDHFDGEFFHGCLAQCKETKFALSLPGPLIEDNVEFIPPPDIEDVEPEYTTYPILKNE